MSKGEGGPDNLISGLLTDLRYALRQLRMAPAFAVAAVVALALTVGLAATVFSVFDAVLVRPLPFGHPSRLMDVKTLAPEGYTQPASWPEYRFWQEHGAQALDVAGYQETTANLQAGAEPVPVHALGVSTDFFRVLDVQPELGRFFRADEGEHGNSNVAVLSYALWQKQFGGRGSVVGSKVDFNGVPLVVIGVSAPGFRFPLSQAEQIYVPVGAVPQFAAWLSLGGTHWLQTIGRLRPGISQQQAQSAMNGVLAAYARVNADDPALRMRRMRLQPMAEALLGQTSGMVGSLALAVLAVLLLGCVNIAGLMLARSLRRERDLVVRVALGASRVLLARQLVVELCLLALAGTVCGFLLAAGLLAVTRTLLITALSRGADVHLDLRVFAASLAAALITLLLAGLLPMRQVMRVAPAAALRAGSQSAGTSRGRNRLRAAFLAAQVALAMLLLVTSAVLLAALHGARNVTLGFAPDHLLLEEVSLTPGQADAKDPYPMFYKPLLDRLRAQPGVRDAAMVSMAPLQNSGANSEITIAGEPPKADAGNDLAEFRVITPAYFNTMGAHLQRGRLLSDALDAHAPFDVVVNQAFVRRFFQPGEDPIGRKIDDSGGMTIVGVTSDLRQNLLAPAMPEYDVLLSALAPGSDAASSARDVEIVLRTAVSPAQLREPLRKAMARVDPTVPFRPAMTMDDIMNEVLTLQLLENWLFGAFGVLALVLALVGLYGLVAQEVEQSRRAIAIRMALGAARGRVLRETLRRVSVTAACGLAVGAVLSYASRQIVGSLLPVKVPHTVLLTVTVAAVMELLAVWAAWTPARRAASVNAVEVLRAE